MLYPNVYEESYRADLLVATQNLPKAFNATATALESLYLQSLATGLLPNQLTAVVSASTDLQSELETADDCWQLFINFVEDDTNPNLARVANLLENMLNFAADLNSNITSPDFSFRLGKSATRQELMEVVKELRRFAAKLTNDRPFDSV